MIILPKGTKEVITVDITDKLGNISTLDGAGGVFDVRMRGQDTWILQNEPITNLGMEAYCLIDTAPSQWKTTTYELFVKFNALPEQPRVGPVVFEIAYGTAADQPPPFDTSSPSSSSSSFNGGTILLEVSTELILDGTGLPYWSFDAPLIDTTDGDITLEVDNQTITFNADGWYQIWYSFASRASATTVKAQLQAFIEAPLGTMIREGSLGEIQPHLDGSISISDLTFPATLPPVHFTADDILKFRASATYTAGSVGDAILSTNTYVSIVRLF